MPWTVPIAAAKKSTPVSQQNLLQTVDQSTCPSPSSSSENSPFAKEPISASTDTPAI